MHRFLTRPRKTPPQLVGRERQNRRHEAGQPVRHQIHRRLRRSPRGGPRREGIQAILRDIVVERAQIHRGELIERLGNRAVVVFLVGDENAPRHVAVPREDVPVDLFQLPVRHGVGRRVEVVEVPEQIPQRVAQLAVRLGDAGEDLLAHADFLLVLAHCDPQADDVRAALVDHVLRQNRVADGLRHFVPVDIDQEPIRHNLAKRWPAARAEADEQRALEPAAVLIAAFEIDVGRPRQVGTDREHGLVARSGIEPDVEDVHLALEARAAAGRARQTLRDEFLGRPLVPGIGAVGVEDARGLLDERRRRDRLAAFRAIDGRDRHTPRTLARDAPVRPVRYHVVHAVVAP